MMPGTSAIGPKELVGPEPGATTGNRAATALPENGGRQQGPAESTDLTALAQELNHKINMIHNVNLQFSIHEGSGQLLVRVMDAGSGEVIREIPPSEMLDLAARLNEMIGLLFDQVG